MPIADRFVHDLAIVTPSTTGELDDYGQPVAGVPTVTLVSGLIQPRSAREQALMSQAGAEVSDHVAYLARRTLSGAAYLRFDPDDGDRYEITGIRDLNFGRDAHLEVDLRRIRSEELVTS